MVSEVLGAEVLQRGLPWRFGNSFYRNQLCFRMEAPHDADDRFGPHPNAAKIAITPKEIGEIHEAVTENGDVRTLPFHLAASGGIDGFFISRITKAG